MKKLILLLAIVFLAPVKADVIHEISLLGQNLEINSTLILKSEEPLDYWEISLPLPENTKLIEIRDSVGEIKYNLRGNILSFKTNPKKSRIKIVNIIYTLPIENKYGFKSATLSLFGFENESTTIVSPNFSYFFIPNVEIEYGKDIKAKGRGPLNVKILFGGKRESKHFFTSSDLNLSKLEEYYWILEGITGIKIPVKFGVVTLSEEEYGEDFEEWSAGIFEEGMIVVREDLGEKEKIRTAMHEAAHGFNSFVLDWDNTKIAWFDEGIATYVSSVVSRLLNLTTPEIFGKEIKWREGNKIYYLEPYQEPEDLGNYYKKEEDWMLTWNPKKYSDHRREFGYAYSELFIREYLKDNPKRLHSVYKDLLEVDKKVEDEKERNKIILNILGTNFTPCYSKNLEEIENCTRELNEMSFKIPKVNGKEINYNVEIPELPEIREEGKFEEVSYSIESILQKIINFFDSLMKKILSLF